MFSPMTHAARHSTRSPHAQSQPSPNTRALQLCDTSNGYPVTKAGNLNKINRPSAASRCFQLQCNRAHCAAADSPSTVNQHEEDTHAQRTLFMRGRAL